MDFIIARPLIFQRPIFLSLGRLIRATFFGQGALFTFRKSGRPIMLTVHARWICCCALLTLLPAGLAHSEEFPPMDKLVSQKELPDVLKMFDGTPVATAEQWEQMRKPELKNLFQHYMYGQFKPATKISAELRNEDRRALGGKVTMRQIAITVGPRDCPKINLLLVTPNKKSDARPPVVLGLNFEGNHTVLNDPDIALPKVWMPAKPGVEKNVATDASRGNQADRWQVEHVVVDRGYALATFYYGDAMPDKPDFNGGIDRYFRDKASASRDGDPASRREDDWGAIAIWAWGLQRAVDYLVDSPDVDGRRIVLFGHSRNGKAALLAGAFDERVPVVIPHQAGCGGTAPSRRHNLKGEPVEKITKTFPHWFAGNFSKFAGQEDRLPFDQHCLAALCAPRAVLFTAGEQDQWADPPGQFEMLKAATPVYRLLGRDGLGDATHPEQDKIVGRELAYFTRQSPHTVDKIYWDAFLDFADRQFAGKK